MRHLLPTLLLFIPQFLLAQNTIDATLIHDGLTREYRLYIPASYDGSSPVPLVFNLHGYGSNNLQQELYGDFRPIADTANFILVHPNGTFDGTLNRFWSAFGTSTVDDVGFISALIDEIQTSYSIDPNCIYSTGMSNGGFMSYELACQLSNRVAAIASVTGSMIQFRFDACNASHPTPVMQIHGTADPTVLYTGNPAQFMMHVDTLVKRWASFNSCDLTPTVTPVPNTNTTDGCTAEQQLFSDGEQGVEVELYKVVGGGHTWPGAPISIGVTNHDFDASTTIWNFFRKYKLNNLTSSIDNISNSLVFNIFPNPSEEKFNLRFDDSQRRTITVSDATGRVVSSHTANGTNLTVKLEKAGVYCITVEGASSIASKRIIVQ